VLAEFKIFLNVEKQLEQSHELTLAADASSLLEMVSVDEKT
jgi:hypothetical protein